MFYTHWGNILSLDFFHVVKTLMSVLPILSIYEKLDWSMTHLFPSKWCPDRNIHKREIDPMY